LTTNLNRCIYALLLLGFSVPLASQTKAAPAPRASSPGVAESAAFLRTAIQSGRLDDLRWPVFTDFRIHVDNFYRPSGYVLAWIYDGKPTDRAQEMIQVFLRADVEGLNPEDYDGPRWAARLARFKNSASADSPAAQDQARFDLALTVCAMRYISAVRIGRINPKHLKFGFDVEHKKLNLPAFLRQILSPSADLKSELAQIEPPFAEYKASRLALAHFTELAKEDDGEQLPPPPGILFPGGPYSGIARLTKILHLTGDLPQDVTVPADTKIYDAPLVDAVKSFQAHHGLRVDGYLTKDTVADLNVPFSERAEQLRLALERYRWLPYEFSQPPVLVNVPGFRLDAFDKTGKIALTMAANVGDSYDFQTPVFENSIRYLVFRPYWNVPPRILREEVIPDIEENRDYVQDTDMEVTNLAGQVVTSGTVSDAVLKQLRAGSLTVRQKPGPDNALGLVKFIFPNEHHVYLHDTPQSVDMFNTNLRAFSHGCIHVQHPAELAQWLLRDKKEWTLDRVEQAMHEGRDNFTVNLTAPIPILIVYATAVVQQGGEVFFYRDIYGHDAALEEALAKGYPYP
jgi:L,D-transpeptidase YcbB